MGNASAGSYKSIPIITKNDEIQLLFHRITAKTFQIKPSKVKLPFFGTRLS